MSRAHRGVLLLNDLPAFGPKLAPMLAILDDRTVSVERAGTVQVLPAAFQLVATARPCPCGWFGDPEAICTCTPALVRRYQQRIPAALRDRIELHLEVPRVAYERLTSGRLGEPSTAVREPVVAARQRQSKCFADSPGRATNAEMGPGEVRTHCALDAAGHSLMKAAVRQLDLSAGACARSASPAPSPTSPALSRLARRIWWKRYSIAPGRRSNLLIRRVPAGILRARPPVGW